jgi:hypothetical protein
MACRRTEAAGLNRVGDGLCQYGNKTRAAINEPTSPIPTTSGISSTQIQAFFMEPAS